MLFVRMEKTWRTRQSALKKSNINYGKLQIVQEKIIFLVRILINQKSNPKRNNYWRVTLIPKIEEPFTYEGDIL